MHLFSCLLCFLPLASPWWDDYPRIVQSPLAETVQAHHGNIALGAAHTDPGWGLYGQMLSTRTERLQRFQAAGLKSISYTETFGTNYCYIGELGDQTEGDEAYQKLQCTHWNWKRYGGGETVWVGMHNWFDDEAFARPYTRRHPRYGGPAMTYPDGTPATGYSGAAEDPRNSRVYDASMAKDILGNFAIEYFFFDPDEVEPEDGSLPAEAYVAKLLPVGEQHSSLLLFAKDSACPYFADYAYASTRMSADHGSDGIWSDNYSAWDSFGLVPVQNAFGEWSVARFRSYVKEHFDGAELATMGVDDVDHFDVRQLFCDHMTSLGGNKDDLSDPLWRDARWLENPLWRAYVIFKRQSGTEALRNYYKAVKTAAAESGRKDYFVAGNDLQYMLGWCRGDLDMVSSEMAPGWGLMTGPRGITLFPEGRFAPLYKIARLHAQSPFVNIWLYLENKFEGQRLNRALVNTFYYEMLATQCLPMFHPGNPRVAGTDEDNAAFFAFVERIAPHYGARTAIEDIGLYYSSSSALRDMTPGGTVDFGDQSHHFELLGWATALGELHLQYGILPEWNCDAEALDDLSLLIIPDAAVIDRAWLESTLKPWLLRGGQLLFTGASGRYQGEDQNFEVYGDESSLQALAKESTAHYLEEPLGRRYYLLDTQKERASLLPRFKEVLKEAAGELQHRLVVDQLPSTVGLNLYKGPDATRFFIDLNNMNWQEESGTIEKPDSLSFALRLPSFLEDGALSCQIFAPNEEAKVSMERREDEIVEIRVEGLAYYAGLLLAQKD